MAQSRGCSMGMGVGGTLAPRLAHAMHNHRMTPATLPGQPFRCRASIKCCTTVVGGIIGLGFLRMSGCRPRSFTSCANKVVRSRAWPGFAGSAGMALARVRARDAAAANRLAVDGALAGMCRLPGGRW